MKKSINNFCRMLGALLLCAGLVITSCEDVTPLGNGENVTTEPESLVTVNTQNITYNSAKVTGKLNVSASDLPFCKVVVYYSNEESFNVNTAKSISTTSFDNDNKFTFTLADLDYNTKYNYSVYAKAKSDEIYTEVDNFTTSQHPYLRLPHDVNISSAVDLSENGTANSYIVSNSGTYKFKSVKGNSNISVGNVASTDILWETFGSDIAPYACDIIKDVCHNNEYIAFETADIFKEGNAVLSAKDAEGNILWSWHIWFTDRPEEHVYFNNAGTMMDRNLGATSADPGDVGALGLLYQWGRKDPFLGSSSISSNSIAESTITWPSTVSYSSNSTIDYAIAHPTTFITTSAGNSDWCATYDSSIANKRWTTSEIAKSIYDPCPAGWRVPDGNNGIWEKALGSSYYFGAASLYNSTNKGINFSGEFGSISNIWYPASGIYSCIDGSLLDVGSRGLFWSASRYGYTSIKSYCLSYSYDGYVFPCGNSHPACGLSVRCLRE